MRNFLLRLLLFFIPVIGAAYFLDFYFSQILRKSNAFAIGEYATWNAIMDGNLDSEILIYGSSRAWVHFNASKITSKLQSTTYNLGIDGHNFRMQYLRHKLMLQNNPKPKLIIQSLDAHTLFRRPDLYNPDQFLPYMYWNDAIYEFTSDYEGFRIFDYKIPMLRYYGKLNAFKEMRLQQKYPQSNIVNRVLGYKGREKEWPSNLKKTDPFKIITDPESVALFEKYIRECKSLNIQLLFVYPPEFIEGQNTIQNRSEIIAIYSRLGKKYNIPFYDYSNDTLSKQKKLFYNTMHLNKTGAELFTDQLIQRMKFDPALKFFRFPQND